MPFINLGRVHSRLAIALSAAALVSACGGSKPAADDAVAAAPAAAAPAAGATAQTTPDGATIYLRCAACHQPTGLGLPGAFPPLAGSEIANGPAGIPIRIVLRGLQGPIKVHGATYNGVMPAFGTGIEMSDAEVAAVLTYVRTQWGNSGGAVTAVQVTAERAAIANRPGMWTAAELGLKQ